jgi:hypothetical protein
LFGIFFPFGFGFGNDIELSSLICQPFSELNR